VERTETVELTVTEPVVVRDEFSPGRVVRVAATLVAVGVLVELVILRSIPGAVSLTAAGVVAIINFRWLEVVLNRVIQPGAPRFDSRSIIRFTARLLLLGAVLAAVLLIPGIDPVGLVVGFSTLVAAIVIETVRAGLRGGGLA
jgi:hypothetical protein